MTVDEICDIVFPNKSGYVRGHGARPKPHSKAHRLAEECQKAAEERARKVEKLNEDLLKQMAELKAHQDEMEAMICEKMQAEIRQQYEEQGWTCQNSVPSFLNENVFNCESIIILIFLFLRLKMPIHDLDIYLKSIETA